MHKSKGNAIWFDEAAEKMGVDVMRWMFCLANPYENLNFGYTPAQEIYRRFILIMRNVYQFFTTYTNIDKWQPTGIKSENILDEWLLTKYNFLIKLVTDNLEDFQPQQATLAIQKFIIDDLSTWYLRRSRKRRDREFYATFYQVLMGLLKLFAPMMPFMAENLYQTLKTNKDPQSVHLCDWPRLRQGFGGQADQDILDSMGKIRELAEKAHSLRAEKNIRLRQPLAKFIIDQDLPKEYQEILKEEINVLEIVIGKENKLDTKITSQLKKEGILRYIIRAIQDSPKKAGLNPADKIAIGYYSESDEVT